MITHTIKSIYCPMILPGTCDEQNATHCSLNMNHNVSNIDKLEGECKWNIEILITEITGLESLERSVLPLITR